MQLKIKKLHPDAIIPRYQTDGAACFDLHALARSSVDLLPSVTSKFRTGLSFEVPAGYVMLVFSRSGHGFKNDVRLSNCVGVIDSDYRGEVVVKLRNDQLINEIDEFPWSDAIESTALRVNHGDRIAQAMLVQVPRVELVEVEELSDTARGAGGMGSTGA